MSHRVGVFSCMLIMDTLPWVKKQCLRLIQEILLESAIMWRLATSSLSPEKSYKTKQEKSAKRKSVHFSDTALILLDYLGSSSWKTACSVGRQLLAGSQYSCEHHTLCQTWVCNFSPMVSFLRIAFSHFLGRQRVPIRANDTLLAHVLPCGRWL